MKQVIKTAYRGCFNNSTNNKFPNKKFRFSFHIKKLNDELCNKGHKINVALPFNDRMKIQLSAITTKSLVTPAAMVRRQTVRERHIRPRRSL